MTIEITKPEVEALIQERIQSGAFASAEDVILQALRSFKPELPTGEVLVAAMQASPYKESTSSRHVIACQYVMSCSDGVTT